ncbi:BamA/TamA family outer membrane protein [Fulvivirga sp. M361]|uniref:BamA/TamA family outer membrane protein n=1 Tax=Fulvivirga sp. M361 TaxID=2594266 RepID=UPI00117B00BD|nr:BamA/TamA family outer membrane protein [Fulvivirga sp. M361]TRX62195.1 BamA/TamA family outer membrane protein [Fulvivirga sp. M361]
MFALLFSFLLAQTSPPDSVDKSLNTSYLLINSDTSATRYVEIDNIFIIGNKVTKNRIILREMDVQIGSFYDYQDLREILEKEKYKIQNLRLFNSVEISTLDLSPNKVDIVVRVKERWYTFPAPIFDLVDRNFNDWWQNRDGNLGRTNFGVKLTKNNFRGRNESLRLVAQFGFTQNFRLAYRIPQIDKSQKHGLSFAFDYSENKNIGINTLDHLQTFFDAEELLRIRRNFGIGYRFRKSFYTTHNVEVAYNHNSISDTIAALNPEYYGNGRVDQTYFRIKYSMIIDRRDFSPYPLKGYRFDFQASKLGLGFFNDIDQTEFNVSLSRFYDVGKNFYFANYSSVFISTPENQPYANISALGFRKDFIRGYELFLIEGRNYYLNRTTFKKKILSFKKRIGIIPIEQFREFPLDVYIKSYFDAGYAENYPDYEQSERLANRFLFGTGLGIDFVTYYDSVFRFEYSVNREREAGLFFHLKKEF